MLQGNRGLPGHFSKEIASPEHGRFGDDGRDIRLGQSSVFIGFSSPSRMEGGAIVVVSPGLGQGVNNFQLHYIESISGILKIVQE